MKGCTKTVVENGAKLIVNNSEIGYCGWQGIEVGGWYECCQGINSGNCDLSSGCNSTSEIDIFNSKIHYADIAVLSGFRDDYMVYNCSAGGAIPAVLSGGAVLDITGSLFSRNYIDLLFREYDDDYKHFALGLCGPTDSVSVLNKSVITNNVFVLPSNQLYCNSIPLELSDRISIVGGRCHIVDLADSSIFYNPLFPIGTGQVLRGYLGFYSSLNFLSTVRCYMPARINNNVYSLPCSSIKLYK